MSTTGFDPNAQTQWNDKRSNVDCGMHIPAFLVNHVFKHKPYQMVHWTLLAQTNQKLEQHLLVTCACVWVRGGMLITERGGNQSRRMFARSARLVSSGFVIWTPHSNVGLGANTNTPAGYSLIGGAEAESNKFRIKRVRYRLSESKIRKQSQYLRSGEYADADQKVCFQDSYLVWKPTLFLLGEIIQYCILKRGVAEKIQMRHKVILQC